MTVPAEPTLLDTLTSMIDGLVWQRCGPQVAALAVLGQPVVADALRAVAGLRELHQPRVWADGKTRVCRHCEKAYPCPSAELLGVTR